MVSLLRELEEKTPKIKEFLFPSYFISCITISSKKYVGGKWQSGYGKISKHSTSGTTQKRRKQGTWLIF